MSAFDMNNPHSRFSDDNWNDPFINEFRHAFAEAEGIFQHFDLSNICLIRDNCSVTRACWRRGNHV